MKTKKLFLLPALIAVLNLIPADPVTAQTFTTLHSFTALPNPYYTNSDGAQPSAALIANSSGNTLYGTAGQGGSSGAGTVFAVNTDGTGFTNLHSFTALVSNTNSDGSYPQAELILSGNTLYGTAFRGGSSGHGTVFAVHTDGSGFTNLHSFTAGAASFPYTNSDGRLPLAGLILSGNTLYGTADQGGSSDNGTVFKVNTNGTGFTTLHSFTARSGPSSTNSDGVYPQGLILSGNILYGTAGGGGSLGNGTMFAVNTDGTGFTNLHSFNLSDGVGLQAGLLSGNTLYGTAAYGGSSGSGTVFALNTNGTGFTNLYSFTALSSGPPYPRTNSDGANPDAGLILSNNTLYGTAAAGGSSGRGTVFTVNTDGTGFTILHSFSALSNSTNSDGANPRAGLILSGNTLYGTANYGGSSHRGTVFAVNTDGTGFTTLHGFTGSDGAYPYAGLILSGDTLYGTAEAGGSSGNGTVFSLSFRPQLTIARSAATVVVAWPTNVAGFDYTGYALQSAPALTGPFTNLPAATNPYTNLITGARQFYRLSQ